MAACLYLRAASSASPVGGEGEARGTVPPPQAPCPMCSSASGTEILASEASDESDNRQDAPQTGAQAGHMEELPARLRGAPTAAARGRGPAPNPGARRAAATAGAVGLEGLTRL